MNARQKRPMCRIYTLAIVNKEIKFQGRKKQNLCAYAIAEFIKIRLKIKILLPIMKINQLISRNFVYLHIFLPDDLCHHVEQGQTGDG